MIDKCIVEIFINDGEDVSTDLYFQQKKNGAIEFFDSPVLNR